METEPSTSGLRGELEMRQAVRVDPLLAQAQQQAPRRQHPQLAQVPPPEALQRLPHLSAPGKPPQRPFKPPRPSSPKQVASPQIELDAHSSHA